MTKQKELPKCTDCKYYSPKYYSHEITGDGSCHRPVGEVFNIVNGETEILVCGRFCSWERRHVNKLTRLLGNTDCGREAIHFVSKNT